MNNVVYTISYKIHADFEDKTPEEKATAPARMIRVKESNLQRAINRVANHLKENGLIESRNDVVFLEGRVTV